MNNQKKAFNTHGSVMATMLGLLGNRGKRSLHGSRHRRAQMKFFGRPSVKSKTRK